MTRGGLWKAVWNKCKEPELTLSINFHHEYTNEGAVSVVMHQNEEEIAATLGVKTRQGTAAALKISV